MATQPTGATIPQLAEKYGVHRTSVVQWLKAAKITPLFSMPYGRGAMSVYDAEAANALMVRKCPPPAPPAPVKPATVPAVAGVGLPVFQAAMDGIDDKLAALLAANAKLAEQNIILLRTLSGITDRLTAIEKEWGIKQNG